MQSRLTGLPRGRQPSPQQFEPCRVRRGVVIGYRGGAVGTHRCARDRLMTLRIGFSLGYIAGWATLRSVRGGGHAGCVALSSRP